MSKLMSLEKIENRIKIVVELTEHTQYTNLKALAEDSEMPKYQLQALLLTKFLYKAGGLYHCQDSYYLRNNCLKKMFFAKLAEAVQDIYRHKESSYLKDVYEVQYNYKKILEFAERKLEENQKELDYQAQLDFAEKYSAGINPHKNEHPQKLSFWIKLKNFFRWKK